MAYYNTCSRCGSNLDPCEICDCKPVTGKPERTAKNEEFKTQAKGKDRIKK